MCGGAIIADLIPRRDAQRVTASDIWPNSNNTFFHFNKLPSHRDSTPLKRPLPSSGKISPRLSLFLSSSFVRQFVLKSI